MPARARGAEHDRGGVPGVLRTNGTPPLGVPRRATGEPHTADDLLQDAYYRLLRARVTFEDDGHRRNYLFRIATNLVRDRHRRPSREVALPDDGADEALVVPDSAPDRFAARRDVTRALDALEPRDRDLLWLAYTLGLSHAEMAARLA